MSRETPPDASPPRPLSLALLGASGRMGQAIARIANEGERIDVVARFSREDSSGTSLRDFARIAKEARAVVIDFSSVEGTRAFAPVAAESMLPMVVGTTGLGADGHALLAEASRTIPIFYASNMSVGVHVLGTLVAKAAALLGDDFDIEIVETHHRNKVDAPSGTALTLLDRARARPSKHEGDGERMIVHGRSGRPGARPAGQIGMHALRGGDVIGDHSVHFLGDGERLELVHRATSRDVFARGAIRAAEWLKDRTPGLYGMDDLLAD